MNAIQHARARRVIDHAVFLCDGHFVRDEPEYARHNPARGFVCCAFGELALDVGYTYDDLVVATFVVRDYVDVFPRVAATFGLDAAGCLAIVDANDLPEHTLSIDETAAFMTDHDLSTGESWYDCPAMRKAAVLATLDRLVEVTA